MKIKYGVVILLIAFMFITGCTTECIPVKPTSIIYDQTGDCYVVIENTSFTVNRNFAGFDCNRIKLNETNWVQFDASISGSPITNVCEGHK